MAVLAACFGGSAAAKPYAAGERLVHVRRQQSRSHPAERELWRCPNAHTANPCALPGQAGKAGQAPSRIPADRLLTWVGATVPPYRSALDLWASRGYVVVAPTFPLSSGTAPGGPGLADYREQPADVSFVISRVLRLARREGLERRSTGAASAWRGTRSAPSPALRWWRTAVAGTGGSTRPLPGRRSARLRGRVVQGADAPADGHPRHGGPHLRIGRGHLPRRIPTKGAGDPGERTPHPEPPTVARPARRGRRSTGSTATSTTTWTAIRRLSRDANVPGAARLRTAGVRRHKDRSPCSREASRW